MKQIGLTFLLLAVNIGLIYADDYRAYASEIRKQIWQWDMPAFKEYTVPDKYQHESAVILARHHQLEATGKSKFYVATLFTGLISKQLYYTNIDRIMIKLNDQKALDDYSTLSFKEQIKTMGLFRSNLLKTVVGARIIKPDGSIRELEVDDDAVEITEGKKDKAAYKQLAVKGLETGDILDYFYCEEMILETEGIPSQTFMFTSSYPTLSYSVSCVLGEKLTGEYRSVNGAPDFAVSKDEDNNTILSASRQNLEILNFPDNSRWISASRDLPMIRLIILNNESNLLYKPRNARKKGVHKDVPYSAILDDAKEYMGQRSSGATWLHGKLKKNIRTALSNYRLKKADATEEDIAAFIYDALRLYWDNGSMNNDVSGFIVSLEKLLKENNIECKIGFAPGKYGARRDEIVEADDLFAFVSANNNKQFFFYPNGYRYAGEIPYLIERGPVSGVSVKKYRINAGIDGTVSEFQLPASSASDNKAYVKTSVTLQENNLQLSVNRQMISTGEMKDDFQRVFLLYEDWDKLLRKHLLIETDIWQEMQDDKNSRKYIDQYKTHFEEKRTALKEFMQQEAQEFHMTDAVELIDYQIKELGAIETKPFTEYELNYRLDGYIKKAGEDLILDAGKLIGIQWTPSDKDRNWSLNTYLEFPSIIEREIIIEIPPQYKVEGIERLNKSIENNLGSFKASATMEGTTLRIMISRIQNTDFISKTDWTTFLSIVDMANLLANESVILKKTK